MIKAHILIDKTREAKKIKNFLDYKIANLPLKKCNQIIVVGGGEDGLPLILGNQ